MMSQGAVNLEVSLDKEVSFKFNVKTNALLTDVLPWRVDQCQRAHTEQQWQEREEDSRRHCASGRHLPLHNGNVYM